MLKVLHLAAGNRWTGAAAPAFAEVEALRAAGVDAHYAYVGGYKLEKKIGHFDFTHALIEKAQNPISFGRTVTALRHLIDHHGFDVVHAHLTYDHWLARFSANGRIARTFHAHRVLRTDPFTRSLLNRTAHAFVINDAFRTAPALAGQDPVFTPPPLDHRQFHPNGPDVRASYGVTDQERLITVIGKLSRGRGFEEALHTFAAIRRQLDSARMMIIGHGEHRPALEQLSRDLGIAQHMIWAGYHEDDLAEHYRAADLLLFTARGSDEGHRAILEAMACGVPPAVFPLEGVPALVEQEHIAPQSNPDALAETAVQLLGRDVLPLRGRMAAESQRFGYRAAAARLVNAYGVS